MNYIIESIDNIGKSTLVNELLEALGYHTVIHSSAPKGETEDAQDEYVGDSLHTGFHLLENENNIIFDRFHLGEMVYSELYRGISPGGNDWIIDVIESQCITDNVKLILLDVHNMDLIVDDGFSINHANSAKELAMFKEAFYKSTIKNKHIITVDDPMTGKFKTPLEICMEVINAGY